MFLSNISQSGMKWSHWKGGCQEASEGRETWKKLRDAVVHENRSGESKSEILGSNHRQYVRGGRERGLTGSIYSHLENTVEV